MKNAIKVAVFTVLFIAVAAGAIFGIIKFNKSDFAYTVGSKKNEVVITAYNGKSVNIEIPKRISGKKVVSIGENAFDSTKIKTVTLPETVTSIESNAFKNCSELEKITFNTVVESFGEGAFYNCDKLTELTIPSSVKEIGSLAFNDCDSLKSLSVEEGGNFVFENGVLYSSDKTVALCSLKGTDFSNYKFPAELKEFGEYFFFDHDEITSFEIPESMTEIPENMFALCSSLKDVKIHDGVKKIGGSAFLGCVSIDKLYVPASVQSCGSFCFPANPKKNEDKDKDKNDTSSEYFNPNFTLVVEKDSYAYRYAVDKGIKYELNK